MAGIGVLNDVKVKVYGMQSINLNTEAIKVLGINFPYNRKLKGHKKKFKRHNQLSAWVKAMEIEKSYL